MNHFETLMVAAAIILVYSLISVQFSRSMQPLRLRVIDDIKILCANEGIPDDIKDDLEVLSENLFSQKKGWVIVILFPFVMIRAALRKKQRPATAGLVGKDRSRVTQAFGTGMLCMIATSPLCTVIFAIEFIISLMIVGPLGWVRSLMRAVSKVDGTFSSFGVIAR